MPPTANLEALTCSFCNKSQSEVVKLVAGAGVYICNECVELCNQIITEELDRKEAQAPQSGRSPKSQDPTTIKVWDGLSDDRLLEEMVRAHAAHQSVDRAVAHHVAALRARALVGRGSVKRLE